MARICRSLLCLLLVAVMLVGCAPTGPQRPSLDERLAKYSELGTSPDDNYRTWYEIFVYSFCDSNGDGIGDLQGVISKLDYVKDLGFTGIWLMPVHPSTSYHTYNVDDYYAIDPSYGTMADFDQLITECDKRGIKVIMDLVVNHSGDNNPWFKAAVEYLEDIGIGQASEEECEEFGYYHFVDSGEAPNKGYHKVPNTRYHYEGQFDSAMPDLNWDNEKLRDAVKDVMEFWLKKGVAGFRVDAAKEFYTGNVKKNVEVMNWLQTTATSINPDAYMVAEVWETDARIISMYYESGFTSIFNYPYGNTTGKLMKTVNGRTNAAMVNQWATGLEKTDGYYSEENPNYIDAPFLSNHDVLRIADGVSNDPLRIKMAGALNLFMSGSAFVYYGEEIGMCTTGNKDSDPSKRAPMYWNAERNNGTTTPCPGCVLPSGGYPMGSVEEQKNDESSVYNYYREAIAIRNALPVIARGKITAETALNNGCISAMRKTWNDQECIILMNIDTKEATVDLSSYSSWKLVAELSADGNAISMDGSSLKLPAYGIAILIPNA